ncbi:MAG: CheR family methyltransferase [Syntrophomonadaceae bacterium]|jgi:chemotaxis protein methyltransferase CheR
MNGKGWEWFIKRFEVLSKIDLTAYKRPQMERRINSFMRSAGCSDYGSFIEQLQTDRDLFQKFLEHITINVSEFFRNTNHWQVLEDTIIPILLRQRSTLKIWSAGCSTGEEPYSLAIMTREKGYDLSDRILASDLDTEVLNRAQQGIYAQRVLQGVPGLTLNKYFVRNGSSFMVKPEIKNLVRFKQHDLLRDPFPRDYDLILCRNVVIYFTEETKQNLYRRFTDSLRPGGVLFIGSTEQIFNNRELGLNTVSTFFYQKNDSGKHI